MRERLRRLLRAAARLIAARPPAAGPDLSVVIVNDGDARRARALADAFRHGPAGQSREIVLVDNASDPSDRALLPDAAGDLAVVALAEKRAPGECINIGAERARGRLLFLIDPAVQATASDLSELMRAFSWRRSLGAVGPMLAGPGEPVPDKTRWTLRELETVGRIPSACMLVRRHLFLDAGGFDAMRQTQEDADTDLCLRIRQAGGSVARLRSTQVRSTAAMATAPEPTPAQRDAFARRRRAPAAATWRDRYHAGEEPAARPRHACFTPYDMSPGGGERYMLTLCDVLSGRGGTELVTRRLYSRLHVRNLGAQFGLDLADLAVRHEPDDGVRLAADLQVTMGNEIVPTRRAGAGRSIYICQFPFPALPAYVEERRGWLAEYRRVVVYSRFAQRALEERLADAGIIPPPIVLAHPPVATGRLRGDKAAALAPGARRIVSVGRFFVGSHAKRHDQLILAFRRLHAAFPDSELHLVGALAPAAMHAAYLDQCRALAEGLPVHFHVDADLAVVDAALTGATVYWHGTGLTVDREREPWALEHFGIGVVEGMDAGCITFALDAAGPAEIITDGVDGFLYADLDDLVARTARVLAEPDAPWVAEMSRRAVARAADFSEARFSRRWTEIVEAVEAEEG